MLDRLLGSWLVAGVCLSQGAAAEGEPDCVAHPDVVAGAKAALIVTGTIRDRREFTPAPDWSPRYLFRGHNVEITLDIERVIKGRSASTQLRIFAPLGMVHYEFPSYPVGARVLIYLVYDDELSAYQVCRQYFKLAGGVVVGGRGFHGEPPRLMTEERLKDLVRQDLESISPREVAERSAAVISATVRDSTEVEAPWRFLYKLSVDEVLRGHLSSDVVPLLVSRYDEVMLAPLSRVVIFLCGGPDTFQLTSGFIGKYDLSEDRVAGAGGAFRLDEFRSLLSQER